MSSSQSIETAPRDRVIHVYNDFMGWYLSHYLHSPDDCGHWPMYKDGSVWYPEPSKWQPLPDPPGDAT